MGILAFVEPSDIAEVITEQGEVVTGLVGMIGQSVDFFIANPIMLLPVIVSVGFAVFKIVPKLMRRKG